MPFRVPALFFLTLHSHLPFPLQSVSFSSFGLLGRRRFLNQRVVSHGAASRTVRYRTDCLIGNSGKMRGINEVAGYPSGASYLGSVVEWEKDHHW
mgnify:CR=1 FL=1